MKIFIYKIYFPTSKKYYIGQTNDLDKRMIQHLNHHFLVGNALWKYDDWKILILHTCKTRDEANRIEIECIRNSNSIAPNGYNLTRGGDGQDPKITAKIGKANKGRKYTKEINKKKGSPGNQFAKGHQCSKESKKKMGHLRNQFAKGKNLGKNNPSHRLDIKVKRLKRRLIRFEQELENK